MLIIFGGLPGVGKTTIARELARQVGAVHLRVDSIEEAIRGCVPLTPPLDQAGYRVAYAIAEDNLRVGRMVIADSVNALGIVRDAWRGVAERAQVQSVEVEVICSDRAEHKRRVEERAADIVGLKLPSWEEVASREYDPWKREHVIVDTSRSSVDESVKFLQEILKKK
jgi:predicted kinase